MVFKNHCCYWTCKSNSLYADGKICQTVFSHKLSQIDEDSVQQTNNASEICCFSAYFLAFTLEAAL